MLVLQRRLNERVTIGDEIKIMVTRFGTSNGQPWVKLGITAPFEVPIHREEVYVRIQEERDGGDTELREQPEQPRGDDAG